MLQCRGGRGTGGALVCSSIPAGHKYPSKSLEEGLSFLPILIPPQQLPVEPLGHENAFCFLLAVRTNDFNVGFLAALKD